MKKMPTLFKKDPNDLGRVINEIHPDSGWVISEPRSVTVTQKYDGTAAYIFEGDIYKRFDAKPGRKIPFGAIPCQKEPDPNSNHWPHWIKCDPDKNEDRYFFEGLSALKNQRLYDVPSDYFDGTYELVGPKVNANPEKVNYHLLLKHRWETCQRRYGVLIILELIQELIENESPEDLFNSINLVFKLKSADMEGVVFHHEDGRMCKIRLRDFGVKREGKGVSRET